MYQQHFETSIGDVIFSETTSYKVLDLLGQGTFGEVAQCKKSATKEIVALKILKSTESIADAKHEEVILKRMKALHSENCNIVGWNDSFVHNGHFCLEFEMLDICLAEYLQNKESLSLAEIRPIVQQLAVALRFLDSAGIIHADLKPENIMMVDCSHKPMRVKLIDFGLACDNPKAAWGATLQTIWYRSPEILLGAPFGTAIDTWSLGCTAAELLMGTALFPGYDTYDMMRHIYHTIGKPPDHHLNLGLYTRQFFRAEKVDLQTVWRFMTPYELRKYMQHTRTVSNLSELVSLDLPGEDASADQCDRENFLNLLEKMLEVDAHKRITPGEILQHPFITMSHLDDNSSYLKTSKKLMDFCQAGTGDVALYSPTSPDCSSGGEEPVPQSMSTTTTEDRSSPNKKRKRAGDDLSGRGNNSGSDTSPPKRKRRVSDSQGAALTQTGPESSPNTSRKRRRDETDHSATPEGSSPKKKREVHLSPELTDSANRLFSYAVAKPGMTPYVKFRKRTWEDEGSGSDRETSPVKRRREEGGEDQS